MRTTVIGIALVVVGLVITGAGLFGRIALTEDEGHHDGRVSTFALQPAQGTDELIVEPSPNELEVSVERAGQPIQSYDDVHGVPMHVFTVTDDLTGYMHVDPAVVDGLASVSVPAGSRRVAVQTAPSGGPDLLELGTDVTAPGDPLLTGQFIATADLYTLASGVTVERQGFDFVLSEPWQGDEYHGGPALLVMFREGDGAFVHAHAEVPSENRFRFNVDLPGSGTYLAALEFLRDGNVETALFRFEI